MASTSKAAAKRSRASSEQLRVMVDILAETEGMVSGKFQRLHGKLEHRKKWRELAQRLNAIGGAAKTVDQWITVWSDLKRRTSKRLRDVNSERAQTGNRPRSQAPLTDMEMRIIDQIGNSYCEGADICDDSVPREEEFHLIVEEDDEEAEYLDDGNSEVNAVTPRATSGDGSEVRPVTPRATNGAVREVNAVTPRNANCATPRTTATPRTSLKRKRAEEERAEDRQKFMEIADKQAATLRMLAENQAKQTDALQAMANAMSSIGDGLKAIADAINRQNFGR